MATADLPDVVDHFREQERLAWVAFTAAPSIETRREHFHRLMLLLREIDARAEVLLLRPAVQTSGKEPSRAE